MDDQARIRELSAVDLNLLVVLDVLLREQSVSRAAQRLSRSQSTISHALGRLRTLLSDPLLLRDGRRMVLTPRAEALRQPLSARLAGLHALLGEGDVFDPARSTRRFRLLCPDLLVSLMPTLWAGLSREAPGVRLAVQAQTGALGPALLSGAGDLALGALPSSGGMDVVTRGLGRLQWVTAMRNDHPALSADWGVQTWARWPHLVVTTGSPGRGFVGEAAAAQGIERTVGVTVGSSMAGPHMVAASDLFFNTPRALIAPLAERLGLTLRPLPLGLPPTPVGAMWSRRLHADAGHRWFRERVIATVISALQGG